ncbi:MAG: DNA-directed RNA polymerase subunit omega [Solirubrobacteraceae bacterium]
MNNFKNSKASLSTQTYDRNKLDEKTQNIYEAIAIMAKRAKQIDAEMKIELINKLEEFSTNNDSLEEVFENVEQIEVSKFYERLPKPSNIAIQEWLDNEIYFKRGEETEN